MQTTKEPLEHVPKTPSASKLTRGCSVRQRDERGQERITMSTTRVVLALAVLGAAGAETITGTIYCDNTFKFWFGGELVAADPMSFTPHQAVEVSFEWDGTSPKHYAISCSDFATESGYEYTETNRAQLGDGALLAKFSDGTVTGSHWHTFVTSHGPTDASVSAGCSASNLDPCALEVTAAPADWTSAAFDSSGWANATVYTEAQAGWGRTPTWDGSKCCTVTSPLTREDVGCSVDPITGNPVEVKEKECLDPKAVLQGGGADFIWTSDLERDNEVLFVFTAEQEGEEDDTTPAGDESAAPMRLVDQLLAAALLTTAALAAGWQ